VKRIEISILPTLRTLNMSLCLGARSRDGYTVINKCLDKRLALDVLSVEVVVTPGRIGIKMAVPLGFTTIEQKR
jgi:hypothetical protein